MEQFKVSCQYTIIIQSQLPVNCTNSKSVVSKMKILRKVDSKQYQYNVICQ